jgi:Fe-Mn family superoxide dismutase
MSFTLPDLPYAQNALAPHISPETLDFHHGKHHAGYVAKLNGLIDDTDLATQSLETIIRKTAGDPDQTNVFNNAAQIWNHSFYWKSMSPNGGGAPTRELGALIDRDFGSLEGFVSAFSEAGATQFGSGWVWLVLVHGKLEIRKTANAQTPLTEPGVTPLLTMDVWEHAYYIDFQNRRPAYIAAFLEHLINWEFAAANLAAARIEAD